MDTPLFAHEQKHYVILCGFAYLQSILWKVVTTTLRTANGGRALQPWSTRLRLRARAGPPRPSTMAPSPAPLCSVLTRVCDRVWVTSLGIWRTSRPYTNQKKPKKATTTLPLYLHTFYTHLYVGIFSAFRHFGGILALESALLRHFFKKSALKVKFGT